MTETTVAAVAAVATVIISLIGLMWKIPQSIGEVRKDFDEKIGGVEQRLGSKFDELNRSVGRIEGRLQGSPMDTQAHPPSE